MNIIPSVNSSSIKHALLIDITINGTVYRISNAYGPITYNGNLYTQLGNFLSMTEIQGDLKITNNQLSVVLSGIPPDDGVLTELGGCGHVVACASRSLSGPRTFS